ncbi:MAG: asparagine synthase C-terminal domain-containing protein, partial [Actinomycetota bacterium]|nr:asparagine synthase C-terminal domain-containing protein [Actinomycetota bacterium]
AAADVRKLLDMAVRRRLTADVPLGAFLSGGIDSSAIVAIMSTLSSEAVKTFTIGFDDEDGYDERRYARQVARRFGTDHVEFVVKPRAVDLVDELVWHYDQPFGDSSAVPTYLLAELTRGHVTVALCGDGGDELFAGYERFTAALLLDRYRLVPAVVRRQVARSLGAVPSRAFQGRGARVRRFVSQSALSVPEAYLEWVAMMDEDWRWAMAPEGSTWAIHDYQRIWEASEGADLLDRLLELNLRTYLLDDLLPKVDRMSMAHGLEVRSPFLDRELVELALHLPRRARVRGLSRKRALKAAVQDLLPAPILHRRKRGFGVPIDRWFRGELRSFVDATLGAPEARVRSHVNAEALERLWHEHRHGGADHGKPLWTLLTLEAFLRKEGW